jgi:non-ribosomal peptide synthetase component F
VLNVGTADPVGGTGAPGTVLSATPEGLVVACGSGAVRLNRLTCQIKGGPVCPSTVADAVLPALTPDEATRLTAELTEEAPRDAALRAALAALSPLPLAAKPAGQPDWRSLSLKGSLPALALAALRALGADQGDIARAARGLPGYLAAWQPLRLASGPLGATLAALDTALAQPATGWPLDLMTRDAALQGIAPPPLGLADHGPVPGTAVTLTPTALHFDAARIGASDAQALADRIAHVAAQIAARAPETELAEIPALTEAERDLVLTRWNATARDHDRSLLVIGALAIWKAGGAYVPLDPDYPPTGSSFISGQRRENRAGSGRAGRAPARAWRAGRDHSQRSAAWLVAGPESHVSAGKSGLSDLYLGLDRAAQGGDGRTSQCRQFLCRHGCGDPASAGRCLAGGDQPVL